MNKSVALFREQMNETRDLRIAAAKQGPPAECHTALVAPRLSDEALSARKEARKRGTFIERNRGSFVSAYLSTCGPVVYWTAS